MPKKARHLRRAGQFGSAKDTHLRAALAAARDANHMLLALRVGPRRACRDYLDDLRALSAVVTHGLAEVRGAGIGVPDALERARRKTSIAFARFADRCVCEPSGG